MRALVLAISASLAVTSACGSIASSAAPTPYETRRSTGEVSFAVTPRAPADGRFTVDIRADTHSGDLGDLDLSRIVTLEAGGRTYRPSAISPLSGHHATGSATFDVGTVPDRFTVRMTGVRNMEPIAFEWP